MALIDIQGAQITLTQRQRWSHYFALFFALLAFLVGVNLRNNALNATTVYVDTAAGIRAQYPRDWLVDTDGDYVFRVRDTKVRGFKTTFQVALRPVSPFTESQNILTALSLERAQTFAAYRVLAVEATVLPDDVTATRMTYTFVSAEINPFLETVPQVVTGLDVLTLERGQAIIITYLAEADEFESNLSLFERFIGNLEF